jgi:predicted helicase
LADLHLNYETVKPYFKVEITGEDKGNFIVDKKICFVRKDDKTAFQYNHFITISNIPLEAYENTWLMDVQPLNGYWTDIRSKLTKIAV